MSGSRPFTNAVEMLRHAGLRPTRPRLFLTRLLFERDGAENPSHWHATAEQLHESAAQAGCQLSLATVYNTLNSFVSHGLLREVVVDSGRAYFDTNTGAHHHFFHEEDGRLEDIPADQVPLPSLPAAPEGKRITSVDVVIRVARAGA